MSDILNQCLQSATQVPASVLSLSYHQHSRIRYLLCLGNRRPVNGPSLYYSFSLSHRVD